MAKRKDSGPVPWELQALPGWRVRTYAATCPCAARRSIHSESDAEATGGLDTTKVYGRLGYKVVWFFCDFCGYDFCANVRPLAQEGGRDPAQEWVSSESPYSPHYGSARRADETTQEDTSKE